MHTIHNVMQKTKGNKINKIYNYIWFIASTYHSVGRGRLRTL